jgi:hypothetical protein
MDPKLWTVEHVASWLKSERFDQDICEKFAGASFSFFFNISKLHMRRTANLVDGEVLLELDDEMIRSRIGIVADAPRHKIMKAINDLFPEGECEYLPGRVDCC